MPTRRSFLLGLGAASLGGVGCKRAREVTGGAWGGVDFKLLVPPDKDDRYPLVVAIHGNGGAPEHWVDGWRKFPGRASIALPRGFEPRDGGFAWFSWNANPNDARVAADVAAAEERLWKGVAALAAGRRVVVAGYTEGAVLAFASAARRADVLLGAFAVAGACPDALVPKEGAPAAPLTAYHGVADDVVPIDLARASVRAFRERGHPALLREYPGVGHSPTDKVHADLDADMMRAL